MSSIFVSFIGCGSKDSAAPGSGTSTSASVMTPSSSAAPQEGAKHGHSHERDKMLIADAGAYHALLTAHLAANGNELDVFFETPSSANPQPAAIAVASFEALATTGDSESYTLTFEPAPAEERPVGEKAGTCSHFVAKAPWMKPDNELLVVAKFTIDGNEIVGRWRGFVPRKFAHHVE